MSRKDKTSCSLPGNAAKKPTVAKKNKSAKKASAKKASVKKATKKTKVAKKIKGKVAKKTPVKKKTTTVRKTKARRPESPSQPETAQTYRWLSVSVEEGCEHDAARTLKKIQGIEQVLFPTHDDKALYPGYIFVYCNRADEILIEICQANDVEGVLARNGIFNYAFGGHEAPVELEEKALQSIRNSCTRYLRIARSEMMQVQKGQRISITSGTFSGMVGQVVSVHSRKMIVVAKVCLSDGGMVKKVSIKHGEFETIEESRDDDWRL